MKKILTILAASAMFFAFGDVSLPNGINFENYANVGENSFDPLECDPEPGGQQGSLQYWYSASSVGNVISNHVNGTPDLPSGVTAPDMFNNSDPNNKFLYLETESPLFRTVGTNGHSFDSFTNVSIATEAIYLDTLVKFTAADSAFTSFEDAADKIAIEYVEHEEESHEDPELGLVIDSAGFTNFVIRAGYVDGDNTQTNYLAAVPAGFDKDKWHRLTVRSIADVGGGYVGFVVYLDQVPLEYATSVAAGNAAFVENLNQAVTANFYNENIHALYPSAVRTGGNKTTISAVAFSGNGSVDDVVFTTDMPEFIASSEEVSVKFTADSGVTAISVKVGEADPVAVDMTAAELVAALPPGTTAFTVTATIDGTNGYAFDKMTVGDGVYTTNPASITGYAGDTIAITTARNNFNLFDGNGAPISGTFQTLGAALAANGVAKIQLAYDYTVADWEDNFAGYTISKNIVLDLNGKTINGGSNNARCLFAVALNYTLTVVNSVNSDNGKIVYGGTAGVFDGNNGDVVIGSSSASDYGPVIDGPADGERGWVSEVYRGKFLASENTGYTEEEVYYPDGFGLTPVLDSGSTATLDGDYWVVTPAGGSEPTEIAVPTAIEGLIYNKGEQTGVEAGTGYTLTGNVGTNATSYTAVATLEDGYAWVGGSTDPTNIEWSISMKGVTPTIVLNPTSAQFDPNKTTVGAYVTSVAAYDGEDLLTENLDYLVSGLTEEVTEAGEYKVWVVQKGWDPGQNYMITNSQYATLTITAGGSYPSYIENITDPTTKAAYEEKYDTWKATYGADTESAYEEAFLLNCSTDAAVVAAEKAAFKFTSISYDATQSKWVTTTTVKNTSGADYNGTVVVKQYSDVGCKTESSTGTFFKAFLQ